MDDYSLSGITFVIRFLLERSDAGVRWRGSIEHIPSGDRCFFLQVEELVKFLKQFGIQLVVEDIVK